jgi:hypothetical protein
MTRVLLFLVMAAAVRATEVIGSDALRTVPVSQAYSSMVNNKPGDGETVDLNPPRFCWSYLPVMTGFNSYNDTAVKSFRFQISANSNMSSPSTNVTCNYPWYNALAPLTAGNTYYWQIEYRTPVTVDATNDFVTSTSHGMLLNQEVTVSGTGIPGNLAADTTYFVRDVSAPSLSQRMRFHGTAATTQTRHGWRRTTTTRT